MSNRHTPHDAILFQRDFITDTIRQNLGEFDPDKDITELHLLGCVKVGDQWFDFGLTAESNLENGMVSSNGFVNPVDGGCSHYVKDAVMKYYTNVTDNITADTHQKITKIDDTAGE